MFAAEPGPSKRRKMSEVSEEAKRKLYEEMKNKIVPKTLSVEEGLPTVPNAANLLQQRKAYDTSVEGHKREETYWYCLNGRNFCELQKFYGRGKKFIKIVQDAMTDKKYSRSHIYFLISLHQLALTYNKITYLTIGIGIMKSKFRLIKELVEADPDFWKNPPL